MGRVYINVGAMREVYRYIFYSYRGDGEGLYRYRGSGEGLYSYRGHGKGLYSKKIRCFKNPKLVL